MRPLRLRAAWAFPVDAPPIPRAAVLIDATGRLAMVGPDSEVPSPADADSRDVGDAALLPRLVNTHTHLELTGFEGQAPETGFREWILTIRRIKEARSAEAFLAAARRGLRDCWAAGVTTIADTGDSGAALQALAELSGSGIAYQEVFGPHPDQAEASLEGLRQQLLRSAPHAGGRVRIGVSPHAPYTVSAGLYARVAALAAAESLPIAVHLAESPEESALITRGTGPFAEAWQTRGIPLPQSAGDSPVAWLDRHGVLGPGTLCIHVVQLSQADIAILQRGGSAVAHCPLSNARHHHGVAPLGSLRAAGVRVGIGTDSVASVGRLDLLAEARAARRLAGLSATETLALCTRDGARALGMEAEIGSLSPGKWGDLLAITLPPTAVPTADLALEAVLASAPEAVVLTVLGGRVVHTARAPA